MASRCYLCEMSVHGTRKVMGSCGVAGPLIFTAAWLVAWPLQKQYSPRREDISALAALDAQHAWIMILGFIALAAGTTALGLGLIEALRGWSGRVGSALVMVAGVGLGVAGLARNDCSSELAACAAAVEAGDVSGHHEIHDLVSLVIFLALIAAQLTLARVFKQDPQWRDLRTYSIVSGVLTLALLVLFGAHAIDGWNGIVQRIFLAVPWVWIVVLGLRLSRLATLRAPRD
jgi:hypothetical membrane protein